MNDPAQKVFILIGLTAGSVIGGYIPDLWGAGLFSMWSILFGALGSLAGIFLAYKLYNDYL